VACSPDGKRLASGSEDRTVRVWDARTGRPLLTLTGHTNSIWRVSFSANGKWVYGRDRLGTVLAWDAATGRRLPGAPSGIPAGSRTAVHGNRRFLPDGPLVRVVRILSDDEKRRLLPEEERVERVLQTRACREFHAAQAEAAEQIDQTFAAVFHLDRLLRLREGERPRLLERRTRVLSAALKKAPGDAWVVRTLARQAVSNPLTVPERKKLVPVLAALAKGSDDAADHRLHGGVLVRTGSAKEALAVLQTAIEKRRRDGPPVEELLLALANVALKQPGEARKHLQTAVAWMLLGADPVRTAAGLVGLAGRGPLPALGGVLGPPPDPRRKQVDAQTMEELIGLRGEVEKALAGEKP
jgi:hypothetical protein